MAKNAETTAPQRIFQETQKLIHDLFRLKVANMIRNVSWTQTPELTQVAHEHFFHTYDSDGVKQTRSTSTGSHFHEITVIPGANPEDAPTIKVGPAKTEVKKQVNGKLVKVIEPCAYGDQHTHEPQYESSCPLVIRTMSKDAVAVISKIERPPQSVPGIQG